MIKVYTDGACSGNPGPGGWGAILVSDSTEITVAGSDKYTTNNKMELTAAIQGILSAKDLSTDIILFTDSQYVKNGITAWINNWKKNGWRTANKKPVKNKELWIKLDEAIKDCNITFQWVKGHSTDYYNNKVDALAVSYIAA